MRNWTIKSGKCVTSWNTHPLGFLSCPHTMFTYTRCMDSVLRVPFMLDVAVGCDLFARHQSPSLRVARATAYFLFKVPRVWRHGIGSCLSTTMQELEKALDKTAHGNGSSNSSSSARGGRAATSSTSFSSSKDAVGVSELSSKAVAAGIISSDQASKLAALQ